jgi:DNA (cytosine-5)-methyltransferase 1
MMKVLLDLFSGVGGFAQGLIDAGMRFDEHYFSEIDKHAIANYKHNFPHAQHIGSVTDVCSFNIKPTIITFGWPCQDNSIAGKRKGQRGGSRSGLFFHAINAIEKFKPQSFIAENVKGLYSVNAGYDSYEAIRFLTYLNSDNPQYTVEMQLLNTSWVLPQNRERTYFIGHLGTGCAERVFPFTENDFGAFKGSSNTPVVRTITGGGEFRRDAQQYDLIACVNDKGTIRDTKNAMALGYSYYKGIDFHGERTMIRHDKKIE